jgi:hypothetical protein
MYINVDTKFCMPSHSFCCHMEFFFSHRVIVSVYVDYIYYHEMSSMTLLMLNTAVITFLSVLEFLWYQVEF